MGAVRAGGFAGRPKDWTYISAEDFQTVEDNIALMKPEASGSTNASPARLFPHDPPTGVFISFTIYRQTGEDGRLERDNDYFVQRKRSTGNWDVKLTTARLTSTGATTRWACI